jgi:hypothetical protein
MFTDIVNFLLFQVSELQRKSMIEERHGRRGKSYILDVIRTAVAPDVLRPGIGI